MFYTVSLCKLGMSDLNFGEFGMMFGNKFNTYITYIFHVIYSTVVLTFVFQTYLLQHLHHSIDFSFRLDHFTKICFDIDIFLEIFANFQSLCLSLQSQTCANVPIATSHKTKISFFQKLFALEPFVKNDQCFLDGYTLIDLFLRYSSQLSAEFSQLRIESGPDILMERIQYLVKMSIDYNDRELNDLRARVNFIIFYTCSLKIKYKQILDLRFVIFCWQIESDIIDLSSRVCCSIFLGKFDADIANVRDIINTTMMPTLVFYIQNLQHMHHASHLLQTHHFSTIFLNVNVAPKIFPNIQFFIFGLVFKTVIQIPITTSYYSEITFVQIVEFIKPFVQYFKSLLNVNPFINHFLGDSCQLSAEGCKLRIEFRFHILMENIEFFACRQMYNDDGKLDDL